MDLKETYESLEFGELFFGTLKLFKELCKEHGQKEVLRIYNLFASNS